MIITEAITACGRMGGILGCLGVPNCIEACGACCGK